MGLQAGSMRRTFLAAGLILVLSLIVTKSGEANPLPDHGVVRCGGDGDKDCLALSSPFVTQVVKARGEVTWCVDQRGSNYPGFVAQVERVTALYASDLGLTYRQVPMPVSRADLSCVVRHEMPETHACSGCAAWVYTQSYPILIEYNWRVGYIHFESTIGHESWHLFCLGDENYDKVKLVSWILTHPDWQHGRPTVGDVGTPQLAEYAPLGIFYLTAFDLERCSETLGRDVTVQEPAEEWGPCEDYGGGWITCWNSIDQLWHLTCWEPTEWRHTGQAGTDWFRVSECP